MNKKLISKCCSAKVREWEDGYICFKCEEVCEVIEDIIPQPIQKEEVKGKIKDLEDVMQSIKEIIIGNSIWRKYPDGHTDFNEMNLDKILCLIATSVSELITNQNTPTPSDTFIESKMKEFDKKMSWDYKHPSGKEHPEYIEWDKVRSFLKFSLQSQEKRVREGVEKECNKKWKGELGYLIDDKSCDGLVLAKDIKQLLK